MLKNLVNSNTKGLLSGCGSDTNNCISFGTHVISKDVNNDGSVLNLLVRWKSYDWKCK